MRVRAPHVLVVDDDPAVVRVVEALLRQEGISVTAAADGTAALDIVGQNVPDVVVADLRMPGLGGLELLRTLKTRHPGLAVILLTAHGVVPDAVAAMRDGAADFLSKPFERETLLEAVERALGGPVAEPFAPETEPIGVSTAWKQCEVRLRRAARSNASVLLRGPTGVGKDVAAQAIHRWSARRDGPFARIQCAAMPSTLLESELFGHERGAFTGAHTRKAGRVERAQGGTIFLDEIGDVGADVQVKLLELLQEKVYTPVGAAAPRPTDARIIAATHRDLESMVQQGSFREDLYYRLQVIPVTLPSLAERSADIPALVQHFVRRSVQEHGIAAEIHPTGLELLASASWPGNIRQLANFVERLVVLSDGGTIGQDVVMRELATTGATLRAAVHGEFGEHVTRLRARRMDAERGEVFAALREANGNRTKAARILGVSRRTLYNKLGEMPS